MPHALTIATWALPLLYLVPLVDYGISFFLRARPHRRSPWLLPVVIAHGLYLVGLSAALGRPPVETNAEILSIVAISTAVVYLVVEAAGHDRRSGVFMVLLVFLFQYTSSFLLTSSGLSSAARPNWERLHVVPAILAYTAFSVAAVYGLLHLLAERGLRRHRFGVLFDRLPSLDLLASMSWRAVVVAFVLITITVATAAVLGMTGRLSPAGQSDFWNPKVMTKVVVGGAAWLIYTVAVIGRIVGKWPLRRISLIAVNGFVVVAVLFVVSVALS